MRRRLLKKALSPVIASILLMVLAVAGAMMVYRFFLSTTNTIASNFAYQIVDGKLTSLPTGTTAFYMALKNVGNVEFEVSNVEVSKDGGNWTTVSTGVIGEKAAPGETITIDGVITGLTLNPGDECIVKITVKLPNGDTRVIQEVLRVD